MTLGPQRDSQLTLANGITAVRVVLICWVATALLGGASWESVGVGFLALLLDGVDGWVARQRGEASAFGARFDMETDAAFIAILCLIVWREGVAGAWVLLIGAARYLYVLAGFALPRLRDAPPPSDLRRVICVVQVVALLLALVPRTDVRTMAPAVLVLALVALLGSFGRDIVCLSRH